MIKARRRNLYLYFSVISALSVVTAGALYFAYGVLRQEYLPIGLAVLAVAGVTVYLMLTRVADL